MTWVASELSGAGSGNGAGSGKSFLLMTGGGRVGEYVIPGEGAFILADSGVGGVRWAAERPVAPVAFASAFTLASAAAAGTKTARRRCMLDQVDAQTSGGGRGGATMAEEKTSGGSAGAALPMPQHHARTRRRLSHAQRRIPRAMAHSRLMSINQLVEPTSISPLISWMRP